MIDIAEAFDRHEDAYLEFAKVEKRLSNRPDLHAFLLLDRLVPGTRDIVSAAEHDEFYLEVDPEELAADPTDSDVLELVRCGVRYDRHHSSLCMFARNSITITP